MSIEWLSVEEIANELKVTVERVRGWIRRKELTAYRVGRDYRIKREDLDSFLREGKTRNNDNHQ